MQDDKRQNGETAEMSEEISDVQQETVTTEAENREPTPEEADLFFRLYLLEMKTAGAYLTSKFGPHHSEDILHNAVCAGIKTIHRLENPEMDFVKWFYGVIGNTIALYWRDKATEERATLHYLEQNKLADQEPNMEQNPENTLLKEERTRMANEALGALPEELRTAFTLREVRGLSYPEIAERTGAHENTIRKRVEKAKKLLSLRTRQMVIVGLMDFVNGDRLHAASMRALQDVLASANIPPESVHIVGLTTAGAVGATTGTASASGGAGVSGATSVFSLSGVLLMCGSLFFWSMSVLIGAHAYGASLIQSAPTLPFRGWLIKHLVFAYATLVVALTIFITPIFANVFDGTSLAFFHRVVRWGFVLSVLGYFVWFRHRYSKISKTAGQDISDSLETDHRFVALQRIVSIGFLFTSILIVGCMLGGIFAAIPEVRLALTSQRTILAFVIIFLHAFAFLAIGLFHTGTFLLFRRYLLSMRKTIGFGTNASTQGIDEPPENEKQNLKKSWALVLLLTLGPSIMHLLIVRTRIIYAGAELVSLGSLWYALYGYNKKRV